LTVCSRVSESGERDVLEGEWESVSRVATW